MRYETTSSTGSARDPGGRQGGSAILITIFVLAVLSVTAMALLFMSQGEVEMSEASVETTKAFYLAEAGLEEARTTIVAENGHDDLAAYLVAKAGSDGFEFDADKLQVSYDSNGNVTGLTGYGDDTPLRALAPLGDGWYAAFLTNDPIDGRGSTSESNDRVVITGVGVGRDKSLEFVEALLEPSPILPSVPPCNIFLLGPPADFHGGEAAGCSNAPTCDSGKKSGGSCAPPTKGKGKT